MNITIIDYKSGNLASLKNSLESAASNNKNTYKIEVSNNPENIIKADKVILPGVGDFFNCKEQLFSIKGMLEAIEYFINDQERPFLGICIGMQLMAKVSYERGKNKGLDLVDSEVVVINNKSNKFRVPHMGWNNIELENPNYLKSFSSLNKNDFYFVHSYHMICNNNKNILASMTYGEKMVAAICKDNLIGVQFHPEKSQIIGKKFLLEFLDWKP
ncbi:MAG: imidazole glycerol phosphate synthase subunit HisH [Rickettsiales bacterium]|nr:imidazole glycerol phosphate synthase subunit HisH [Rickettsiales bacterium]OUV76169.1 MAG: imidazole glycerol phosphate synthase subunit HisH [Rickettsiales bacterium TMED131]|tara:strand:+ start:890 stop:1534 length:645 start_codon:yes stop_codon:yes gene_type:complete